MLAAFVAALAEVSAPVGNRQLVIVGRVGIVAADAVDVTPRYGIHVGAFPHPVQMGAGHLFVATEAELVQILYQQFRLCARMSDMAGAAPFFGWRMLVRFGHHLLVVAVEAEFRRSLQQELLNRGKVRRMATDALLAGKHRIVARLPRKALLGILVAIPAQIGVLLDQLLFPGAGVTRGAFSRSVGRMFEVVKKRLCSPMGVMAGGAICLRDIETVVFRLQFIAVVALPAKFGNILDQQPLAVGTVRVMARAASPFGNRLMERLPFHLFLDSGMAAETEIFFRLVQKPLVLGRMVGVALLAGPFDERLVLEFSVGDVRLVRMAAIAELGPLGHEKFVRGCSMGVMAIGAVTFFYRTMDNRVLHHLFEF